MRKVLSVGTIIENAEPSDDIKIAINDEDIDGFFVLSADSGKKEYRFIAKKEDFRSIMKAVLDESE